jgi:hypothetical protein
MNIRNHAPTLLLRTLWEKPGHNCCEPVPAFDSNGRGGYNFDIACISSDWQHGYTNTDNHLRLNRNIYLNNNHQLKVASRIWLWQAKLLMLI